MPMREPSFAAFILTHGRPDRVHTFTSLKRNGYTGRIVILIDNEDKTADEYRRRFGSQVEVFDKAAVAAKIDEGDNFNDRRAIIYARNASFDVAERLGIQHFIQLDDDYTDFRHKRNEIGDYIHMRQIQDLDSVFQAMLDFYRSIPATSIAMAQGGDFMGGALGTWYRFRRKAMNSFICSLDRRFQFFGRINEDVNTYTNLGSRGALFITITDVGLQQKQSQTNSGGMTDLYVDSGTYVKSFYSVMYQPSSVKISILRSKFSRIHHKVHWSLTVPRILSEAHRKPRPA